MFSRTFNVPEYDSTLVFTNSAQKCSFTAYSAKPNDTDTPTLKISFWDDEVCDGVQNLLPEKDTIDDNYVQRELPMKMHMARLDLMNRKTKKNMHLK